MKNTRFYSLTRILLIALVIGVSFEATISSNIVAAEVSKAAPIFSVIWISDTQHLSEHSPTYYDNLCQWIVDNKATYNVKMVIHTGDLVDMEDDTAQWANANHSMSILLNNNMPYCWDAGNHDYNEYLWIGDQYTAFNTTLMATKPYWVSQAGDGKSTAVHVNVSGWDCLIINIAYHADATTLDWAKNLLDAHPESQFIVATHAYLDPRCHYDTWATNLKTILDEHPNVFLTLNGHYYFPTYTNRTQSGNRYELMFDMQNVDAEVGAASARILTFNLAERSLSVQTYALYQNQFLSDANNDFTLNIEDAVSGELFALPEYPVGALAALAACFVAYGVIKKGRYSLRLLA